MTDLSVRVRCRLARLWLGGLRVIFGFDAWHAAAPYPCRPYKRVVAELASALDASLAVELGCGLGDIICRVRAPQRIGIDADRGAIRAARLLHPSVTWIHGTDTVLAQLTTVQRIDCLIMVNWIHALSPVAVQALLSPALARVRFLIVDAIDADGPPSYRYKHDFAFLGDSARIVTRARVKGEPRTFLVFECLS